MDTCSSDLEMSHFSSSTPGEISGCESDEDCGGTNRIRIETPIESPIPNVQISTGHASDRSHRNATETPGSSTPRSPIQMSSFSEARMRRKLFFFFMNPIEKWQTRRRFPYKFLVQLIKLVLVTMQLCLFAHSRYNHVNYTWDNRISFSHLFLKGWDTQSEVESYPPSTGPLALYQKPAFYETIDWAIAGYGNLSDSIGPYSYPNVSLHWRTN